VNNEISFSNFMNLCNKLDCLRYIGCYEHYAEYHGYEIKNTSLSLIISSYENEIMNVGFSSTFKSALENKDYDKWKFLNASDTLIQVPTELQEFLCYNIDLFSK